jgi:Chaperone of endosialidase
MKTTTLQLKHSMNRLPSRLALMLIPLALAWFALSPTARAVCLQGCDTSNGSTFLGDDALVNNTGLWNTAIGYQALSSNTIGGDNVAVGSSALEANSDGYFNVAVGYNAMFSNSSGSFNTATGLYALSYNTTGGANTAYGFSALNNSTGDNNTAVGTDALQRNITGSNNIALGDSAGAHIVDTDFNIDIGNRGYGTDAKTIRIGTVGDQTATFIVGISGATVPTGVAVIVDAHGHLGTTTSSARFKDAIKPMDKASEAILALKPVTFRYKHNLDPEGIPQFGLVAEEVEKVNPDLVARDEHGKPYTVRYEAVNAMLLNEFLKEHKTVQELKKQVAELTAGLQKVSAQLEVSEAAPQTVLKNQ